MSFLDNSGVARLWNKIIEKVESHNTNSNAHADMRNRLVPNPPGGGGPDKF